MNKWVASGAGLLAAGLAVAAGVKLANRGAPAAPAATEKVDDRYRQVTKFAVHYDDVSLGWVEGVAYCKWDASAGPSNPKGVTFNKQEAKPILPDAPAWDDKPQCKVKVRNPKTGEQIQIKASKTVRFSAHATRTAATIPRKYIANSVMPGSVTKPTQRLGTKAPMSRA